MKLLFALIALAPTLASAEPSFWCKEVNAGIDHGYFVNFSSPIKSAEVSTQSIAGPQKLANLQCSYVSNLDDHGGVRDPLISCSEPNLRDAGYSLLLDNSTGPITATLYSITIAGSKAVAQLSCGRN